MTVDGDLHRRLCRARDALRAADQAPPDLATLARVAALSRFHFLRSYARVFGETPHATSTRWRIERAKHALRDGRSVTDVCFDVGFSSLGSFSALFRREVGVPPSTYQRTLRRLVTCPAAIGAATVPFCFVQAFDPNARMIAILEKPLPFRP